MKNRGLIIKISGRVQGVHFRGKAKIIADDLNLTGYAKNLPDGTVEIIVEGSEDSLYQFLEWAQQGSTLAKVEGFEYRWQPVTNSYQNFQVIRQGNILTDQLQAFTNLGKKLLLPEDTNLPDHLVLIPDGNRRWARERNLSTFEGHRRGLNRANDISNASRKLGISTFTLWGFSTENWDRAEEEKDHLFHLFQEMIGKMGKDAKKDQIRFRHLGRKDRLPETLVKKLNNLETETSRYTKYNSNIALDYGGRGEIVRGIQKAIREGKAGSITEKSFSKFLDTHGLQDPDFIIRTSGEQRLSGILPWQGTYAELYFSPLHLPDFDTIAFQTALLDYSSRQRRFGH